MQSRSLLFLWFLLTGGSGRRAGGVVSCSSLCTCLLPLKWVLSVHGPWGEGQLQGRSKVNLMKSFLYCFLLLLFFSSNSRFKIIISSEKLKCGWTLTASQYTITHILYFKNSKNSYWKYKSYIINKLVIYVIYTHTHNKDTQFFIQLENNICVMIF